MNPHLGYFGVAACELTPTSGRRILVDLPCLAACPGNPVKADPNVFKPQPNS